MAFDLKGRVAWVTGGARGIGAAVCRVFAEAGARVAAMDVDANALAELERQLSGFRASVKTYQGDVTDSDSINRVVEEIESQQGFIDILVNNAGIIRDRMFRNLSLEDWRKVLEVNLTGTFLCTQAVIEGMAQRRFGRVINTSSISSLGNQGQGNYAAAKSGIIGFTRTLSLEYAPYGVTVNCVAPGATRTEMTRTLPVEAMERFIRKIPMGRMAEPEEIAVVHLFLASEEARYVTGQVVFVDGGISIGF